MASNEELSDEEKNQSLHPDVREAARRRRVEAAQQADGEAPAPKKRPTGGV